MLRENGFDGIILRLDSLFQNVLLHGPGGPQDGGSRTMIRAGAQDAGQLFQGLGHAVLAVLSHHAFNFQLHLDAFWLGGSFLLHVQLFNHIRDIHGLGPAVAARVPQLEQVEPQSV